MPLLLSAPPTTPEARNTDPTDDRRLEFTSLDGTDLIDWSGEEFIARAGATGLDVPPREVVRQQIPGLPGSRLVEIRDAEREVFLPLWVRAADRDYRTNLDQMARVRRFLDYRDRDYADAEGTFNVVSNANSGQRSLRVVYLDGAEGDYGSPQAFSSWRILPLRLLAVDPYWRGDEWTTALIKLPNVVPFVSSNPVDGFPRQITPSVALGAGMAVAVGGDVPSPATIELKGPTSGATITSTSGLSVTIGALTNGQTLLIDTGRRRRVLLDGSPAWSLLGPSPRWGPLPPGESLINVQVTGATTATTARVYGTSLWESAW